MALPSPQRAALSTILRWFIVIQKRISFIVWKEEVDCRWIAVVSSVHVLDNCAFGGADRFPVIV